MIAAITALLGCQLVGEVLVRVLGLPLPGPVAGLGLLFTFLVWNGRGQTEPEQSVPPNLARVGEVLLQNLSLLFIPAAVGVVQYLGLLRQYAWQIAIAIVLSTALALVVTAGVFRLVSRLYARPAVPLDEIEAEQQP